MPPGERPLPGSLGTPRPRVAAVVLAAGEGTRFGPSPKLLAPFRGRPLAAWALRAAGASGLDDLVVVVGATDLGALIRSEAPCAVVVENATWRAGQASSLRAAVDWCDAAGVDAAVVGLADQPLVPAAAWAAVGRTTRSEPFVTATFAGLRRPPVRIARAVWSLLRSSGDEGARAVMRMRPELVGEVACAGDPADVDTVEDLLAHGSQEGGTGA